MYIPVGVQVLPLAGGMPAALLGEKLGRLWWSCELKALLVRFGAALTRYVTQPGGGALLELDLSLLQDGPRTSLVLEALIPAGYPQKRPVVMPVDRAGAISRGRLAQLGRCITDALAASAAWGGPAVFFAADRAVALLQGDQCTVPEPLVLGPPAAAAASLGAGAGDGGTAPWQLGTQVAKSLEAASAKALPAELKLQTPETRRRRRMSLGSSSSSSRSSDVFDSSSSSSSGDWSSDCRDLEDELQSVESLIGENIRRQLLMRGDAGQRRHCLGTGTGRGLRRGVWRKLPPVPPMP